jgi:hypothetical protein
MEQIFRRKLIIWLLLTINLLFAFIIGISIPYMESESRFNLGFIMIPLLIILNYIILDRFHYYLKHTEEEKGNEDAEI